jgi:hypothetical protein
MKHLISKLKSLFKPKETKILVPPLGKDFFKKANIHFEELDASNIYAKKINASKIKKVWK